MIKILAIDDDVNMTELLKLMLNEPEFEIFTVNSGQEAVEAMMEIKPDIVLLDLMMPNMNGWEVTRAIRKFSQTPILALTAVTQAEGVMQCLEDGVNDYLLKPAPRGILISRIKKLVR